MIKRLRLTVAATFCLTMVASPLLAQTREETGMKFEHGQTWAQVKAKAKKENKYIFVDAYTTWCGPCKMMARNIFPLPEVGTFYNANYINLKVQLDTTKQDNEEVKKWYKDAHDIMMNYNVRVFPTYLFLSPEGKLVHRAVGASDATAFIEKGKNALDPSKQYYTLKAKYDAGDRSESLLRNISFASMEAYDQDNQQRYVKAYFASQKNLLTDENIKMLEKFTIHSDDTGFALMMKYPGTFNKCLGENKAEITTRIIIMREELFPTMRGGGGNNIDWKGLNKKVLMKYPGRGDVTAYAEMFYYQQTGDWEKFAPAAVAFMKDYGNTIPPSEMNSVAWAIFENCNEMACIEEAVKWSKEAATKANDANYYDTHANLLYKAGKKEEAIKMQEQTIALARQSANSNIKEFEATLKKMKNNEKTWE